MRYSQGGIFKKIVVKIKLSLFKSLFSDDKELDKFYDNIFWVFEDYNNYLHLLENATFNLKRDGLYKPKIILHESKK